MNPCPVRPCPKCSYPMRERHAGYMIDGMGADHSELVRPVCPACGEEGALDKRPHGHSTPAAGLDSNLSRNVSTTRAAARPSRVVDPVALRLST